MVPSFRLTVDGYQTGTPWGNPMSQELIFRCEDADLTIDLTAGQGTEAIRQLMDWVPASITIHSAKIAGCHIYWPSPILARLEMAQDIHKLEPGAFLYYPDRQYLEIIYDELQAETAAVTHLGQLTDGVDWLRDFATRQRQEAGTKLFTAQLDIPGKPAAGLGVTLEGDTPWARIVRARKSVWMDEPQEIQGCCQTNSNPSLQGQYGCPLCRAKTAPLGESGGAVGFEMWSAGEASFLVEVV